MIIDTDNYPFKTGWFRGGEPMVDLGEDFPTTEPITIFAKLRNAEDLILYLAVSDAISQANRHCSVFMPYFPGARQDRYQVGFPLTSHLFARVLGYATYQFTVCDIHSPTSLNHLEANTYGIVRELPFGNFIPDLITEQYDSVLAPDKGAIRRAQIIANALGIKNVVHATKHRDPHTHDLDGFEIPHLEGRVLIADDICEGGGTFTGLIDQSRAQGDTAEFDLYVTHGIFSRGIAYYEPYFKNVYTTNSWCQEAHYPIDVRGNVQLHVADLLPAYLKEYVND